jgi:nicotinamide-nucleotide amidase
MPTAEIITIGTELLLGETADTNTQFIARTLRELGVDLYRTQTVGDNARRIATAVGEAQKRADIVITTGGLGPTVDDPTRQAIAEASQAPLEFHPELWEQIVDRIARYGRAPTENQKRQAYIPKGAIVIENPVGTAPAFIVEMPSPLTTPPSWEGNKVIITLPGVPLEMETLLVEAVVPYLQKRFKLDDVIKIRTLHVGGIGEGVLDEQVGDLEKQPNPTVGLTAHSGIVDIRIAAKASTPTEAESMIAETERELRGRLGNNIFGADEDTLENTVLKAIARRGWTLATMESGLGDTLMNRLNPSGHPAYRGGRSQEIRLEALVTACTEVVKEMNATAVLGVALTSSGGQHNVAIVCITPFGQEERQLSYGGHPKNAARWAVNTALDRLRRIAQEAG